METIEYKWQDLEWSRNNREKWIPGEWDNEPDKIQFEDEETGLPCLIVRNCTGSLCGYVGVNKTHPYFEKSYDDLFDLITVYSGLSFSDKCDGNEFGICHKVCNGEDDDIWWLGFASGDFKNGDIDPAFIRFKWQPEKMGLKYRTIDYIKSEVKKLAKQLKSVQKNV